MFRCGLGDAAQQFAPGRTGKGTVGQQDRHSARSAGQSRQRGGKVLHGPFFKHAGDHDVIDLAGALAGDHQAGLDLPQFDAVGHIQDTIEHTKTGVGEVKHGGLAPDAESGGHAAGRGRFELLPADAGIDQGADLIGGDAGG